MTEFDPDRRTLLKSAGVLASVTAFGQTAASSTDGTDVTAVSEDRRTVEKGLTAFVAKWQAAGVAVSATRFGRFLTNRTFNCHVANTGRSYTLRFGPAGVAMDPGRDPGAHATLVLEEAEWEGILYGDFNGLAPIMTGSFHLRRDETNRGALLGIVMYVFAHVPASADDDPEYLARTLQGVVERRGLPACEGEPPALEGAEDVLENPDERVGEFVRGDRDVPDVTRELAAWVHDLSYDDIPDEEIAAAKQQLKSILAATYAGSTTEQAANVRDAVGAFGDKPEATVLGGREASVQHAAMVNTYQAQLHEWEDFTYLAHGGVAIVPALLSVAESENASGEELLTAIVAGNEIVARLGEFLTDVLNIGQAMAIHQAELPLIVGKLLGLSPEKLQDAVGIACTQPQTTSLAAWSADAKGMVTADPVVTSIRAAYFAREGVHGRRDQLENPLGYFNRVANVRSPNEFATALEGLETAGATEWRFATEYVDKRYATDAFHHTSVYALLELREQLADDGIDPTDPDAIDEIRVRASLPMAAVATMFNRGDPGALLERIRDAEQPDWSFLPLLYDGYYPLAAALVDGELTHRQYEPDRLADETIETFLEKIRLVPDISVGVFGAEVTVVPADAGPLDAIDREYQRFVGCIREEVNADYSPDDKLAVAAGDVRSDDEIDRLVDAIDDLERYETVRAFATLL